MLKDKIKKKTQFKKDKKSRVNMANPQNSEAGL